MARRSAAMFDPVESPAADPARSTSPTSAETPSAPPVAGSLVVQRVSVLVESVARRPAISRTAIITVRIQFEPTEKPPGQLLDPSLSGPFRVARTTPVATSTMATARKGQGLHCSMQVVSSPLVSHRVPGPLLLSHARVKGAADAPATAMNADRFGGRGITAPATAITRPTARTGTPTVRSPTIPKPIAAETTTPQIYARGHQRTSP